MKTTIRCGRNPKTGVPARHVGGMTGQSDMRARNHVRWRFAYWRVATTMRFSTSSSESSPLRCASSSAAPIALPEGRPGGCRAFARASSSAPTRKHLRYAPLDPGGEPGLRRVHEQRLCPGKRQERTGRRVVPVGEAAAGGVQDAPCPRHPRRVSGVDPRAGGGVDLAGEPCRAKLFDPCRGFGAKFLRNRRNVGQAFDKIVK